MSLDKLKCWPEDALDNEITEGVRGPFTEKIYRAIDCSANEANWFSHDYIGPADLLLGLLQDETNAAVSILESFSVDRLDICREVVTTLGHDFEAWRSDHGVT